MATAQRTADIDAAARALIKAYHEWCRSDKTFIHQGFEDLVHALIDTAGAGGVPEDRRTLFPLIDRLEYGYTNWQQRIKDTGLITLLPGAEVWGALDAINDWYGNIDQPKHKPIESVADLVEIGCSEKQICEAYGWWELIKQPGGEFAKKYLESYVADELKNPGCHSTKDPTWVHPVERIQRRKRESLREEVAALRARAEHKINVANAVAPEPLAQLIEEGVSFEQICRMKKLSAAELEAACHENGLPLPERSVSVNTLRSIYDPDPTPEQQRIADAMDTPRFVPAEMPPQSNVASDTSLTVETRVILAFQAGRTAEQIAEDLRSAGERVRLGRVEKIIERYEQQPEAFELPQES